MADIEMLHAIGQLLDVKLQPVHERLDRMDERLDGIDERLDRLEERVVCIDKRLTNRYVEYSGKMKDAFVDIDILKKTVHRHSLKLQSAT